MRGIHTCRLSAVALVAASCLLGGCADFPIYSAARDKQGQDVKKTWSDVDLKARFAAAREHLATLSANERETEEKLLLERRDQLIRQMAVGGTVDETLVEPTNDALTALAGSPGAAASWTTARESEQLVAKDLAFAKVQMAEVQVELPPCSALNNPKEVAALQAHVDNGGARGQVVDANWQAAKQACMNIDVDATGKVAVGGAIATTLAALKSERKDLEKTRSISRDQRNAYQAALDAHAKAVKALKENEPGAQAKVQAAANKVHDVLDFLNKQQDVFSKKFLAQERSAALDHFLATVAETKAGDPPPKDATKAELALLLFPKLYDDSRKALADARVPSLTPLVLQKDYEKIQLDALNKDIAAQQGRIDLLNKKLELQSLQVAQYQKAAKGFKPRFKGKTVAEALAESKPPTTPEEKQALEDKNSLLHGAAWYLDAQSRMQSDVRKVECQLDSTAHERALAYAEANAAQWQALIGSSVDQLSAYGASGVKPEMLVALLNSLALLWIGVGVN